MKILFAVFVLNVGTNIFAQKKPSIAVADVREIILETGDGFCFDCERIITLQANDARAKFHGGENLNVRSGDYTGKFAAKDFTRLAEALIKNGFFDLEPRYEGATSDAATVKITVVYTDGSRTSENFGESDDPRFRKIERIFNRAADKIVWRTASEIGK